MPTSLEELCRYVWNTHHSEYSFVLCMLWQWKMEFTNARFRLSSLTPHQLLVSPSAPLSLPIILSLLHFVHQETTLYGATVRINEPVGVIGIACPDQFPLLAFVSLFAPAVVRGNTVVIVPSETAPLSATDLYQVTCPLFEITWSQCDVTWHLF